MEDLFELKYAVILGGLSVERDVCLLEGEEIFQILSKQGISVKKIFIDGDLAQAYKILSSDHIDFAFLSVPEDLPIQDVLEMLHIPYTGSSRLPTALCMDKVLTKRLVESLGIETPSFASQKFFVDKDYSPQIAQFKKEIISKLHFPCVVKPANLGTSIGIRVVQDEEALGPAIENCLEVSSSILVEEFIEGREITLPMMGNDFFGVVEIQPTKNNFYDNTAKMDNLRTQICPAELESEMYTLIKQKAHTLYTYFNCKGLIRIDAILREGKMYFLEINTLPFMVGECAPVQVATKMYHLSKLDFIFRIIKENLL